MSPHLWSCDPANSLPALLAGKIDVAVDRLGSGFFNAVQQGLEIRIVASAVRSEPNASYALFVVRKDLIDAGRVRDFADLKGLKDCNSRTWE